MRNGRKGRERKKGKEERCEVHGLCFGPERRVLARGKSLGYQGEQIRTRRNEVGVGAV